MEKGREDLTCFCWVGVTEEDYRDKLRWKEILVGLSCVHPKRKQLEKGRR